MTRRFEDITYTSKDGLDLFARGYDGTEKTTPLLCMHGLTRNSADFHDMLDLLPAYPAISPDQRGRGRSAYDPNPNNYRPDIYCEDMLRLLQHQGLENVIAIGTSMGGLMAMMLAAMKRGLFKAVIINDIGPEIDPAGLERLRGYVGKSTEFSTWQEAADSIKSQGPEIFPEFQNADWLAFAGRTCEQTEEGTIRFAYDPAIQRGVESENPTTVPPDLWPLFEGLYSVPLLIVRGENSDILSAETAAEMVRRHPQAELVTVPDRGHAPLLTEPAAISSIRKFLDRFG